MILSFRYFSMAQGVLEKMPATSERHTLQVLHVLALHNLIDWRAYFSNHRNAVKRLIAFRFFRFTIM